MFAHGLRRRFGKTQSFTLAVTKMQSFTLAVTKLYILCSACLFVDGIVALVMAPQGVCKGVWNGVLANTIISAAVFMFIWWADMLWWPWEIASGACEPEGYIYAKLAKLSTGFTCGYWLLVVLFMADSFMVIFDVQVLVGLYHLDNRYTCADPLFTIQALVRTWFHVVPFGLFYLCFVALVVACCVIGAVMAGAWCCEKLRSPCQSSQRCCRWCCRWFGASVCCIGLCWSDMQKNIRPPTERDPLGDARSHVAC